VPLHHEQYAARQSDFLQKCVAVKESFLSFGNPFLERNETLIALDTRVISGSEGVNALKIAKQKGNELFENFISERLCSRQKSIFDPIPKNKCKFFGVESSRPKQTKVKELQLDLQLFSKLFVNAKILDLNLREFFAHENQIYPPALSRNGKLLDADKSELLSILEKIAEFVATEPSTSSGVILDGAAVVRLLKPRTSKTFEEYYTNEFWGHIFSMVKKWEPKRVDVVWDLYMDGSLKESTREDRGVGVRRQVIARGTVLNLNATSVKLIAVFSTK
jgi:hypothetical protein